MKRDITIALISAIVVAGICYGLAQTRPNLTPTTSTPFSASTGPAPDGKDHVVMRVNGEPITEKEFALFLQETPEQNRAMYTSPEGRKLLADELVKLKSLEQEGERLGVANDPEVKSRLRFGRSGILASYALRKIAGQADEKRLRAEYAKEKANLEAIDLSHILVAYAGGQVPPRSGRPLDEATAMRKATEIAARLRQGADFAAMAQAQSDDVNSGQRGGSLGPVGPGMLPPELGAVVSKLEPNQISAPVKSPFGIHIFRAGQRTTRSFEEVRGALQQRVQEETMNATVDRLKKQAKVDLDPEFFGREPAAPRKLP